jgi:signal transduction histidine kinase
MGAQLVFADEGEYRTWEGIDDTQRAMGNMLDDFDEERKRLQVIQTVMLNLLEDFVDEKTKSATVQSSMLNILADFAEERVRFSKSQTATLNILEDFDIEKTRLQLSQGAYLNILEDIDIEKKNVAYAYKRIKATNAELEEFVSAASHDLRAPLRVIENASKWLEEDLKEHLTDETRENMQLLRGRVARMETLLDDLLEYYQIGRVRDDRFDEMLSAAALMENILKLLSPPKSFAIKVSSYLAAIQVARMPLQQILMNLVGNAIKHHDKPKGMIEVSAEDIGAQYLFSVKDDGPGIPAEYHEQIFKVFQTLKPRDQVEGSGIGLAMVRKNIEVYGGQLSLVSSVGCGSEFSFTWPKYQQSVHNT